VTRIDWINLLLIAIFGLCFGIIIGLGVRP
jgi:hypothetical protein